jgi:putative protease
MSPKDLCTLPFLDKVLDAGVKILKIEGRGRSPEYTKVTVGVYSEAVKAIQNGEFTEEKVAAWTERLRSVYNRDFWDGYYLGRKTGEWTQRYGSQATKTKIFVGTVTNFFGKINVAEIRMETQDLKVGDDIMIIGPTTGVYEDTVSEIRVDLKAVESTEKGELCSIPAKDVVRRGDKVYKVIDAVL